MKRNHLILASFFLGATLLCFTSNAQLVSDHFSYTGLLTNNGWSAHSGSGTNPISTTTGLSYNGFSGSGIGNAALVDNQQGEDVVKTFTAQNTNGQDIYMSCLVSVTDASNSRAGDYFLDLGNAGSGGSFGTFSARVFAKISSGNVNFGISNSTTSTYSSTNFSKNTVYLIIVKYTINTSGDDPVSLWVMSSNIPANEASAGSALINNTTTSGSDNISGVGLRQGAAGSVQIVVDGLRVGTSWSEVLPQSNASDYFQTRTSGNWNDVATWESSSNNIDWILSTLIPSNTANTISVLNTHAVTATSDINIDQTIIQSGGALNINPGVTMTLNDGTGTDLTIASGGSLVFRSDNTGSGKLADVGNAAISQNDNVTVERYVPGKAVRKYSFLTTPVTGKTIAQTWQMQTYVTGVGIGGTGTACTGSTGQPGTYSNGFDIITNTNNPSFFYYDGTQITGSRWQSVGGTTTGTNATLMPGLGYRVNVRGDRVVDQCALLDGTITGSTDVTLKATGNINTGNTAATLYGNSHALLGNPYPSEIDWENGTWATLRTANDVSNNLILYLPCNASGTYSVYDGTNLTNACGNINSANARYIASGQAFFVQKATPGNAVVNNFFQESFKTTAAQTGAFKTTTVGQIRIGLKKEDTTHLDEVIIKFSGSAGYNYDPLVDAKSLNEGTNWIKALKDTVLTAIQDRPQNFIRDTASLPIRISTPGNYLLGFSDYAQLTAANIYLIDYLTNTIQDVKANPFYSFSIATATSSQGDNRFQIVFDNDQVGINTITAHGFATIYPNPVKDKLHVIAPEGTYRIALKTISGKTVKSNTQPISTNELIIDTGGLIPGLYLIEIINEYGVMFVKKIVKY